MVALPGNYSGFSEKKACSLWVRGLAVVFAFRKNGFSVFFARPGELFPGVGVCCFVLI